MSVVFMICRKQAEFYKGKPPPTTLPPEEVESYVYTLSFDVKDTCNSMDAYYEIRDGIICVLLDDDLLVRT